MFEGCTFFVVRDLSVETLEGLLHLRDALVIAQCICGNVIFLAVSAIVIIIPPERNDCICSVYRWSRKVSLLLYTGDTVGDTPYTRKKP